MFVEQRDGKMRIESNRGKKQLLIEVIQKVVVQTSQSTLL